MDTFLNIISVVATIIIIIGIVYFLLKNTVGRIKYIKKFIYSDFLYIFIGVLLIIMFFDFHLPR